MNIIRTGEHPSEEQLMDFALSSGFPEISEHIDICVTCSHIVSEFRKVKERVDSVGEEEVPEPVKRSILNVTRYGRRASSLQSMLLNPFLIALAVGVVVILLYFLVGSEVFKTP